LIGFLAQRDVGQTLPVVCALRRQGLDHTPPTGRAPDQAASRGSAAEREPERTHQSGAGGTAAAGIRLVERLGGAIVGCAFVVNLPDLGGRAKLEGLGMSVHALCDFEGL